MSNLKTTLSAMAMAVGVTLAASPSNVTSAITNVQFAPNYTGANSPFSEGAPVFYVNLGGNLYASNYNSGKTKAFYEMAKSAAAAGKSVWIWYDTDYRTGVSSCLDYSSTGCISKSLALSYRVIQEMAIIP